MHSRRLLDKLSQAKYDDGINWNESATSKEEIKAQKG